MNHSSKKVFPMNLQTAVANYGLSNEEAQLFGIKLLEAEEATNELGMRFPSALRIPFYDPWDGDSVSFYRYRRLEEGLPKYAQPRASGTRVWFPPSSLVPVQALEEAEHLVITEGEFKAIKSCLSGVYTLGITGVDCWHRKGSTELAAPLDKLNLAGKTIHLVYDGDVECTLDRPMKPRVYTAALRFARHLTSIGCTVRIVALTLSTQHALGRKTGLDDYFIRGGTSDELLSSASLSVPFSFQDPVTQLSERYVYVNDVVWKLSTNKPQTLTGFRNECNRKVAVETLKQGKEGAEVKIVYKTEAELWLESPLRPTADDVVSDPSRPYGLGPDRLFNTWKGFAVQPAEKMDPAAPAAFDELLHIVFGKGFEYDYAKSWMAHLMQCPGERTSVGIVVVSPSKGIGKSMIAHVLQSIIGAEYAINVSPDTLMSQFNAMLAGALFVHVEEIGDLSNKMCNTLKRLVTETMTRIEYKGVNASMVPTFRRFYISTNEGVPFRTGGSHERRWLVAGEAYPKRTQVSLEKHINEVLVPTIKADLPSVLSWLLQQPITHNPVGACPETPRAREFRRAGRTYMEIIIDRIIEHVQAVNGRVIGLDRDFCESEGRLVQGLIGECKLNEIPYHHGKHGLTLGSDAECSALNFTAGLTLVQEIRVAVRKSST